MHKIELKAGDKFGRLTFVRVDEHVKGQTRKMVMLCDCGNIAKVLKANLLNKTLRSRVQSCGCLQAEKAREAGINRLMLAAKHGHLCGDKQTPEYHAYNDARQRCTNSNAKSFPDYGGRGIEFRFTSFDEFLYEIGSKPSPELTLDRIDNEGHYEKGNVRWATRSVQISNQRPRKKVQVAPIS